MAYRSRESRRLRREPGRKSKQTLLCERHITHPRCTLLLSHLSTCTRCLLSVDMLHSTHPISCVPFHSLAQPSIPSCGKQPPIHKDEGCPAASPKRDSSHSSYPPPPPPPCAFCLAVWSRRSSASWRCSYGRSASSPRSKRIAKRPWRRSARRSSKVPPTRTSSRGGRASPTISNRAQGF